MKIATWNINSIRLRIHLVIDFIKEHDIDVLCLQETKTEDQYFPWEILILGLGFLQTQDINVVFFYKVYN